MPTLHISQDDTSCWQLTVEDDEGNLTLISHQFPAPDHLIEDARELIEEGRVPNATIIIAPPRTDLPAHQPGSPYAKPAAQRAVRSPFQRQE